MIDGADRIGTASDRASDVGDDRLATIGGIVMILLAAWLVAAWVFEVSLHPVAAPTMSPAIATGSLAVVDRVPAPELEPGDVVIDPVRDVPVRVIGVSASRGGDADAVVTLRGDGEAGRGPHILTITEAERVEATAPLLGWVALGAATPVGGGIAVATVAAVVILALRRRRHRSPSTAQPSVVPRA